MSFYQISGKKTSQKPTSVFPGPQKKGWGACLKFSPENGQMPPEKGPLFKRNGLGNSYREGGPTILGILISGGLKHHFQA